MSSFLSIGIVRSTLLWTGRLLLVAYFAAATLILVGRHWVMPEIGAWRGMIERQLSEAIGLRVGIGALTAAWPGLHPKFVIEKLQLHDREGRPAVAFERVEADVGWSSLLFMELRLHRLDIIAPTLDIRRDAAGTLFVAGLPVRGEGDSGFADWLLEQYRIVVRDARITWHDELRNAPPLELDRLNFVLRNLGRHHSVGLTAEPSGGIASRIDLRANLKGRSFADLAAWEGASYAELAGLDLAALAPWLDLPLELKRGTGDLRLWLDFAKWMPTGFTADLRLADLNLRLQPELAPLELSRIEGRLSGRKTADGHFGEVKRLSLVTAGGIEVPPTQASLKLETGARAAGREQGGELRASRIDLAALAALAQHFPLPQNLRERLQALTPRGRLENFSLTWQGPTDALTRWRVQGGFADLALAAHKELPGFSGISGRLEGDERGGQANIDGRNATIDLPAVFPEPTLAFAQLEAEIGWRGQPGAIEILLQRVNFLNADTRGEAIGTYRYTGRGPGDIDLSARLADAAGNAVWRYMPLVVGKDARDWLRASIHGGRVGSATLRLKGPLAEFPFRKGKGGIFQVKGTFQGAQLDYARGWPGITDIDGELLFEGERMLIRGQRATIMDVALADVRAEIADLEAPEELLTVTGRARGETQRFLDFIEASPVGARIDHFTETMLATGSGELDLKLVLPLRRIDTSRVEGRYRFTDNRIEVLRGLPPFTAAQGEISFTADRLQAKNLRARFLDQPLTLEIGSLPGGTVRIGATGNLEADALRRFYGLRALDHLSGKASWRGSLTVKKPVAELRIGSDLRGLASSLPEPLNKSVLTLLPLTVQGRIEPRRDEWTVALGTVAGLRLQQLGENWRGRLALGEAAVRSPGALPAKGIAIAVNLPRLDIDQWQAVARNGDGNPADKADSLPTLSVIDIRSPELRAMHRLFHDVRLQGTRSEARWQFALASREAQGQLTWDGAGPGHISGRLTRLHLPAGEGTTGATGTDEPVAEPREMPAVDLVIDSFRFGDKALGEVRVKAENRGGSWQAKLDVKNDAAKLSGDGSWRPGRGASETALAFKLDVLNAEKLLDRMGMPDAVRRGAGEFEGEVRWTGSPLAFDLPSLAGRIKVDFGKGQFKKLDPGVGRLLGVLSLQSLPRRITLDFRDIFSEGFAFDSIAGEARIARGVMTTDELRIRGPSAQVMLSGQADLVAETQNLKVRVQPAIGETLAVGAMISNPVVGAVAWAAQKVLKDPLDQIFAFEYAVTGGWSDPQVEKLARQPPEQTSTMP